jgi:hypothetical protein
VVVGAACGVSRGFEEAMHCESAVGEAAPGGNAITGDSAVASGFFAGCEGLCDLVEKSVGIVVGVVLGVVQVEQVKAFAVQLGRGNPDLVVEIDRGDGVASSGLSRCDDSGS